MVLNVEIQPGLLWSIRVSQGTIELSGKVIKAIVLCGFILPLLSIIWLQVQQVRAFIAFYRV